MNLGVVYEALRVLDKAEETYKNATKLFPKCAAALPALPTRAGRICSALTRARASPQERAAVRAPVRRAPHQVPRLPRQAVRRGPPPSGAARSRRSLGPQEALPICKEAVRRDPTDVRARRGSAAARRGHMRLGRLRRGRGAGQGVLRQPPDGEDDVRRGHRAPQKGAASAACCPHAPAVPRRPTPASASGARAQALESKPEDKSLLHNYAQALSRSNRPVGTAGRNTRALRARPVRALQDQAKKVARRAIALHPLNSGERACGSQRAEGRASACVSTRDDAGAHCNYGTITQWVDR
jgi:hypothetical protein